MLKNLTPILVPIVFGAGLLLAACSGGGGSGSPTATVAVEATVAPETEPTNTPVEPTAPPEPTVPIPGLTLDALRNGTYASEFAAGGEYTLVDGRFEEAQEEPLGPLIIELRGEPAFGDLNGDGIDDAVIITVANTGGTGRFFELIAVLNSGGSPAPAASIGLGDRTPVESLRIVAGTIELDMIIHGPEDPFCCPSVPVSVVYVLDGSSLVLVE